MIWAGPEMNCRRFFGVIGDGVGGSGMEDGELSASLVVVEIVGLDGAPEVILEGGWSDG